MAFFLRRRASALVLIVAVLVLLALVGTAFLSTTRTDSYAARQSVHNAQVDMALQSAVNLVVANLTADLFEGAGSSTFRYKRHYRPFVRDDRGATPFENHDDCFSDTFLAARVPVLPDPTKPPMSLYPVTPNQELSWTTEGANPPIWTAISGWPGDILARGYDRGRYAYFLRGDKDDPYSYLWMAPTARPCFGQPLWPCLQAYDFKGRPLDFPDGPTDGIDPIPAADADGDGIADAMLWKLPIGTINGLTYYAATRVIDNNSAINVNTALSRDWDFDAAGQAVPEPIFGKSRIGLAELLRTTQTGSSFWTLGPEFNRLNAYRFNDSKARVFGLGGETGFPTDDAGGLRKDFVFATVGDALERQLGSRLSNAGRTIGKQRYRAFTLADQMALANRFCIADGASSPSHLEQVLAPSLLYRDGEAPVPTAPYPSNDVPRWMDRFNYDAENPADPHTYRDRRALLVARNPLANQALGKFGASDRNRDRLRNDLPDVADDALHSTYRGTSTMAGYLPANVKNVWRTPPRVSINTALFPELWRGFYSVMMGDEEQGKLPMDRQFDFPAPGVKLPTGAQGPCDPYIGNKFQENFAPLEGVNLQLMFRSPIRDHRIKAFVDRLVRLRPEAMILLRSALAAVNAEDLRDSDDDLTDHLITLPVSFTGKGNPEPTESTPTVIVRVRVFGTERQPFITEVYVNTDTSPNVNGEANPRGYVAVELHNPYDRDIPLGPPLDAPPDATRGWSLGLIDRQLLTGKNEKPVRRTVMNLNGENPSPPWRFPPGTVVPAGGYLVLENYDKDGTGVDPLAATYRPSGALGKGTNGLNNSNLGKSRTVFVPHLHRVLKDAVNLTNGGELVLLRTRRADGICLYDTTAPGAAGEPYIGQYDERTNLCDLVPVDQFDFTGMELAYGAGAKFYGFHYVRANDPANGGAWRFVYPGRYDGVRVLGTSPFLRHQGTIRTAPFGPDQDEPDLYDPPIRLGLADSVVPLNQGSFPIQLANLSSSAPRPLKAAGNRFPFGMFAREGDILQVPFIGAYTVYATALTTTPQKTLVFEMNSVAMDSAFAEDGDPSDDWKVGQVAALNRTAGDLCEQIGRFCPVYMPLGDRPQTTIRIHDFGLRSATRYPAQSIEANNFYPRARYAWAADLLEQFTVEAPHADYLPNVSPTLYHVKKADGTDLPLPPPQPVSNSGGAAGNSNPTGSPTMSDFVEDLEPVEGRVNINTAPWKVLAALPLVVDPATGRVDGERTEELAKAIVYFRDVDGGEAGDGIPVPSIHPHGPFRTVFELNKVVERRPWRLRLEKFRNDKTYSFRNAYGTFDPDRSAFSTDDLGVRAGDLTPFADNGNIPTDHVKGDFEEQFLTLTRISNLITTRSDSFTCYVFVMGVENDGMPEAKVRVQKRVGFIVDRSSVRPERSKANVSYFQRE